MELYSQYSGKLGLICFAIWLIMIFHGRRVFWGNISQSSDYRFVFVCMLLFSVLGFLEWDSYHYYSLYKQVLGTGLGVHYEKVYVWLIMHLPKSYFLFRLVVWGGASLFALWSFKRLKLNANVLAMTVPILYLAELTNTRGSLGLTMMIFSTIVFIQSLDRKAIFTSVLAIIGIVLSSVFHRSMFIFIIVLVLSYFVPFNKKLFILSLVAFPLLYGISYSLFNDSSILQNLSDSQTELISNYQDQEHTASNINGIISIVFSKVMLVALVFSIVRKFLYQKVETSKALCLLFKYAYIMVYISFLFLRNDVSNWVSVRTLHAGSFALLMCASHCFDVSVGGKRTRMERIILLGFILTSFWRQIIFIRSFWNG